MANPRNVLSLEGRISEDPSFIKTRKGVPFQVRFQMAVKRSYKNRKGEYDTDFIPVRMEGTGAKMELFQRLKRGDSIRVLGDVRQENFTDKKGIKINRMFVLAETFSWSQASPKSVKTDPKGRTETKPAYEPVSQPEMSGRDDEVVIDLRSLPF